MANKPDLSKMSSFTSEPNVVSNVTSSTTTSKKSSRRRRTCSWRVAMLATPKYITEKYKPEEHCCCHQHHKQEEQEQIPPEQGEQQDQQPNQDESKQEQPKLPKPKKKPTRLESIKSSERLEYLSRPHLRSLYTNKHSYTGNPYTYKDFEARMDKRINSAWDSIYNEYKKAKHDEKVKPIKDEEFTKDASTSPRMMSPIRELSPRKTKTKSNKEKTIQILGRSKKFNNDDDVSKKTKVFDESLQKTGVSSKKEVVKKYIQPVKISSNMNILYKYEF